MRIEFKCPGDQTVMLYALGVADHLPESQVSIGEMGKLAERTCVFHI